jgi:hypothetical protein
MMPGICQLRLDFNILQLSVGDTDPVRVRLELRLKVPKREIFVIKLIILSHPIWIGDLRQNQKIDLYELLGCYLPFWFFSAD